MSQVKVSIVISPESYDYVEEEISYRIYVEDQLTSERSLPIIKENQRMIDTFYLNNKIVKKFKIKTTIS